MFNNTLKRVKDDLMWRFDTKSLEHKKVLMIQEKYLKEAVKHNRHMVEMRKIEISRLGGFICNLHADQYKHKIEMDEFYL